MVIENFFQKSLKKAETHLASPLYRSAAFSLDIFIVLTGVYKLLGFSIFSIGPLGTWLLLGALYEAICLSYFKRTLGQVIMGLETVDEKGQPLEFFIAFVRGFFSMLNVFLLFIPSRQALTNSKRQTFQDKLASSVVISHSKEGSVNTLSLEVLKGLHLVLSVVSMFLFMSYFSSKALEYQQKISPVSRSLASLERLQNQSSLFCEEVESLLPPDQRSRLKSSIELFEKEKISKKCFQKEVNASFCNKENRELSYLGKSLLHSEDKEIKRRYLEKFCSNY